MTLQVIRVYNLQCDRCGEYGGDHVPGAYEPSKARFVRRIEADAGWTRGPEGDVCPRCSGDSNWRP